MLTVRSRPPLVLPSTRTPPMTDTVPRSRTNAPSPWPSPRWTCGQRRFISSPRRAPVYAASRKNACNRCVEVVARNAAQVGRRPHHHRLGRRLPRPFGPLGRVRAQQLVGEDRVRQRLAQHRVDVLHRPGRQRTPTLATSCEQVPVQAGQVGGAQVLQPAPSNPRGHVHVDEVGVSCPRAGLDLQRVRVHHWCRYSAPQPRPYSCPR